MHCLLQLKRAESILQTTETVERWDCDVGQCEQRFGKTLDEDVKTDRCHTCVGTTSSAVARRIIFMSMYNDIVWGENGNTEE